MPNLVKTFYKGRLLDRERPFFALCVQTLGGGDPNWPKLSATAALESTVQRTV